MRLMCVNKSVELLKLLDQMAACMQIRKGMSRVDEQRSPLECQSSGRMRFTDYAILALVPASRQGQV